MTREAPKWTLLSKSSLKLKTAVKHPNSSHPHPNIPKITITGFEEMIIENFKGILEYEDFFIRINTNIGIININGYELKLENMTNDDIKVTGKIESFDLERNTE